MCSIYFLIFLAADLPMMVLISFLVYCCRFANDGVNFSISTDDPLILGNDLNEDYLMALEFGLSLEQIEQSVSIEIMF